MKITCVDVIHNLYIKQSQNILLLELLTLTQKLIHPRKLFTSGEGKNN